MRLLVERTGAHLVTVPGGGFGAEGAGCLIPMVTARGEHPDLATLRRPRLHLAPLRLRRGALYVARRGRVVTHETLALGYARRAALAWPIRTQLARATGRPQLRLQVNIPGPLDLAMLSWGPGVLRHYRAEVQAALGEISAVELLSGGLATYQLEIPAETYLVARTPRLLRDRVAGRLARWLTDVVAQAPRASTWIVHLCAGDVHGTPMVTLGDTAPLVALVNAIAAHWPQQRTLDAVHLALTHGPHPPPALSPAYYAPLAELVVPEGVHVSAGLAHPGADLDDQRRCLELAEQAAGRTLGVSAPCGLGATAGPAELVLERLVALAAHDAALRD